MLNSALFKTTLKNGLPKNLGFSFDAFGPLRRWLNKWDITNSAQAHLICQVIPAQCPFEREIRLKNRTLLKIPPLCKLNPLYEEVVGLRFRALTYLAEACPADVCRYC
jgi:hypothetical protein